MTSCGTASSARIVDAYTEYDEQRLAGRRERDEAAEFANRAERRTSRAPVGAARPSSEARPFMTIEISNESGIAVDETVLLRLMEYNLGELHVSPDADVAILLVDEGAMEALHVQWMDEPGPTDVLSFPMDELRPGTEDMPTPAGLLGDIVLCPQVAETQAVGGQALDDGRARAPDDARPAAPPRLRPRRARG